MAIIFSLLELEILKSFTNDNYHILTLHDTTVVVTLLAIFLKNCSFHSNLKIALVL